MRRVSPTRIGFDFCKRLVGKRLDVPVSAASVEDDLLVGAGIDNASFDCLKPRRSAGFGCRNNAEFDCRFAAVLSKTATGKQKTSQNEVCFFHPKFPW